MTSATFRQSSHFTRELLARDPENRLLARGPRFRLPAELLPRPWRGAAAADLFRRKHAQWKPAADTAWQALTRS